jgi:hypothetical protein
VKVLRYDGHAYSELEGELCSIHSVPESFEGIGKEWSELQLAFRREFKEIPEDGYEFPDWHDNIRMLWVYLYSDLFYTPQFLPKVQRILEGRNPGWFAQFECHFLEAKLMGWFLVYRDSIVFGNDTWIAQKLGI